METPTDFLRFVTETAEDAVQFDGDEFELAHRARNGDVTAVAELSSAYRAIAVLTAVRMRPLWLLAPDAAQEAMLVLDRLVRDGSHHNRSRTPVGHPEDVRWAQTAGRTLISARPQRYRAANT
jgi:hypothetical protein